MAKMGTGVEEEQLVTPRWTRCQKTSNLSCILMEGVKRFAPYKKDGGEEGRGQPVVEVWGKAFPRGGRAS